MGSCSHNEKDETHQHRIMILLATTRAPHLLSLVSGIPDYNTRKMPSQARTLQPQWWGTCAASYIYAHCQQTRQCVVTACTGCSRHHSSMHWLHPKCPQCVAGVAPNALAAASMKGVPPIQYALLQCCHTASTGHTSTSDRLTQLWTA